MVTAAHPLTSQQLGSLKALALQQFKSEGYVVVPNVVDRERLLELTEMLWAEFTRQESTGEIFSVGGTRSGHLNCFPGVESRFVYDALQRQGILALVDALSDVPLRHPNVGCNFNLPGSSAQNEHADGDATRPFLIVNVAPIDTDLCNGAMEILHHTHDRPFKYWQILRERPKRSRVELRGGDVLIRSSSLWHRGMPNLSPRPRPMLAFTWEEGGSRQVDPYAAYDGKITFLPNRYANDWKGRAKEQLYVALPRVGNAFRAVRSFIE